MFRETKGLLDWTYIEMVSKKSILSRNMLEWSQQDVGCYQLDGPIGRKTWDYLELRSKIGKGAYL